MRLPRRRIHLHALVLQRHCLRRPRLVRVIRARAGLPPFLGHRGPTHRSSRPLLWQVLPDRWRDHGGEGSDPIDGVAVAALLEHDQDVGQESGQDDGAGEDELVLDQERGPGLLDDGAGGNQEALGVDAVASFLVGGEVGVGGVGDAGDALWWGGGAARSGVVVVVAAVVIVMGLAGLAVDAGLAAEGVCALAGGEFWTEGGCCGDTGR